MLSNKSNDTEITAQTPQKGLVLWGTRNIFKVIAISEDSEFLDNTRPKEKHIIECRLKGKRSDVSDEQSFLLAGDEVLFVETDEGYGLITERVERKNSIVRKKRDLFQAIAVNIDNLIVVSSVAQPPFRPRFIDRMVYIARCEHINVYLVLNKLDLCERGDNKSDDKPDNDFNYADAIPKDIQERLSVYESIGVKVFLTSVKNNYGLEELKQAIQNSKTAIVGQSGVGKSSIINCLIPESNRATGNISEKYDRGRHITTRPEIIIGDGFFLIDTPGIRELYPSHTDMTSLIDGYPDIFKYAQECKLPNCSHRNEPSCAVQEHIGSSIHSDRYESYLRLLEAMEQIEKTKWQRQKY